eukprot:g5962.t1
MAASSSQEAAGPQAKFDLTHTLSPYLDLHLMFPALQFLMENKVYKLADLQRAQLELLKPTNMVDFEIDLHKQVHGVADAPAEMTARREQVLARLRELEAACEPFRRLLQNDDEVLRLQEEKLFTPAALAESHGITAECIDAYYQLGKFHYDCGSYDGALMHLSHACAVFEEDPERLFQALWGRLAAEILTQEWGPALEDLSRLRDAIDAREGSSELQKLQQRTWLIHWGLFVFFNHPEGRDHIVDFLCQQRMLEAMQCNCPWVLRYFATAFIINKRRRNLLKELVRTIQQLRHVYADPVTELLEALYVSFDFDGAQAKLRECEAVLASDFFLNSFGAEFMENARMFIFETYCRIHRKIDIAMLAEKLAMDVSDAERWIVDLVRNARLDAQIDARNNHVIMGPGTATRTVHQQVIDKTKDLATRTYVLARGLRDQQQAAGDKR